MRILLTLLLVGHYLPVFAQIDTLQNKTSIQNYLKRKYNYKSVELYEVNSVIKDTSVTSPAHYEYWLRADFNHDGKNDLLISASVLKGSENEKDELFVLTSDNKRIVKVDIDNRFNPNGDVQHASFTTYSRSGKSYVVMSFLTIILPRAENGSWPKRPEYIISHDTLFIVNNKPMIYSNLTSMTGIERVKLSTTMCFGTCPVFELAVGKDGAASYRGLKYVERMGNYKFHLSESDLSYFNSLIRNINPKGLKEKYSVDYTDAQTAYLTVEYSNGEKKQIADYGLQGTYGLAVLYHFLFSLRSF